jgi:hypothetical protein
MSALDGLRNLDRIGVRDWFIVEDLPSDLREDRQLHSCPNIRHFLKQLLQSHYPLFSVGQIDERLLADLALSCEFLLEGWLATNVTSLTDR